MVLNVAGEFRYVKHGDLPVTREEVFVMKWW
jgi:hypothetical protein